MESHVHGFGAFGLDVVIDDSECYGVISLHRGWWLLVAHFLKALALWDDFTCIDVQGTKLGFRWIHSKYRRERGSTINITANLDLFVDAQK